MWFNVFVMILEAVQSLFDLLCRGLIAEIIPASSFNSALRDNAECLQIECAFHINFQNVESWLREKSESKTGQE
jgi:hypothetical protein